MPVPSHTQNQLDRFVKDGVIPGDFVKNVLENNLSEAFFSADLDNLRNLEDIVRYVYNHIPHESWGSPEKVRRYSESISQSRKETKTIDIWTDGSCHGNPGPAGSAFLVLEKGNRQGLCVGHYLNNATNNIAELTAIGNALLWIDNKYGSKLDVTINTDSEYCIGILSKGWKAKENVDLIFRIKNLIRKFESVSFIKVKAHTGEEKNELVDNTANECIDRMSGQEFDWYLPLNPPQRSSIKDDKTVV